MPGVFLCGTLARVIHPTYLEQDMNERDGIINDGWGCGEVAPGSLIDQATADLCTAVGEG